MRTLMMIAVALSWVAPAFGQERWRESSAEVRPFAGVFVPVGAHRADFASATMVGAQVAVEVNRQIGTEVQRNVFALRVEARDYRSCFESPVSGIENTRNDLGLSVGLAYHLR